MGAAAQLVQSPRPVRIAADRSNVRQALGELLEEALVERQRSKAIAAMEDMPVANREALENSFNVEHTLPEVYYEWAAYLLALEPYVEQGMLRQPLLVTEATGIQLVRLVRNEFRAAHPPCSKCGETTEMGACVSCGIGGSHA